MPIGLSPVIKVAGAPLAQTALDQLTNLRVERGIRLVGRITLRFSDVGFELAKSTTFELGKEVRVSTDDGQLLMVGVITSTQIEHGSQSVTELIITADDAAVALGRGSRVTTYTESTYSDVVSKVLGEAGLAKNVQATTVTFPYLIQSGSNLQFIEDIADRTGFDWWVGGNDGKTFQFVAPRTTPPALTASVGADLHEFSVRASALHPTAVTVTGWSIATQAAITSASAPVKAGPGTATITNGLFAEHILGTKPLKVAAATTQSSVATSGEANEIAEAASGRAAAAAVTARGTIDANGLAEPGAVIKIGDAGPASGNYRITRVEHIYSGTAGFVTKFTAGERRPTGLVDLLGQRPASAFTHHGLVTGTVTDNRDSEGMGRIRVLINGLTTKDTSAWARIATAGAGEDRGFVVMPEIGDEVLVGFEDGDTRRPVIIGGLFGGKGKMLAQADYGVLENKTVARSLISRLGHRMEISDGTAPAKQHVRLSLEKGDAHMLRVGKDKVQITVPDGVPVEIKAGAKASFIIDDLGNVTIKGQKVTIEAQGELAIKSTTGAVGVTSATQALNLEGVQFALKATAKGEVNGGGILAVKGGMVQIN
ncbi:MAG: Rhs element Vgr protein [Pseudonocardiales bacterium]|nr:Rhs element Vgr protein [Pseudonocardiales bacterium]